MSMLEWLSFGRREAQARIDALCQQREERERRMRPMYEIAQQALPLMEAAELRGECLTKLYVTREQFGALLDAKMAMTDLVPSEIGIRLLGLEVAIGNELHVA